MYKVIIVDDEILARVGIKSLIPWHEHGIELVGECENGKQAYDMAKELLPDIIITDVKMPVMNGIELIKALKAEGMNFKFIMLSSYDDFEFVKEAMRLGAEDYILKLQVEPEELLKVLNNIFNKIEQERTEKNRNIHIKKQIHDDISVLKGKFLKDLICGNVFNEHDIEKSFKAYNIALPQTNLICLVIRIEDMDMYHNYTKDDIYMLKSTVINIIEEISLNYGTGYVCDSEPDLYKVVCSVRIDDSASSLYNSICQMAKDLKEFLKHSMNLTVSIGVSDIHMKYSDISRAYREAREAIDNSFTYLAGSTIAYSDVKSPSSDHIGIPLEEELNELESSLKNYSLSGIQKAFDSLIRRVIQSNNVSKKYMNGICHILIFVVNVFIKNNNLSPEEIWGKDENPYDQVSRLKNLNDFIGWIKKINDSIITIINQENESNVIILRAKQFINKNFCNNISLEVVSEHIGLSPSYFSSLFSRATGESFIDYVTNLRINLAKQLLKSSKYKIYEISEMVGYDNTHYFSRIFKKNVGVSPLDFKAHNANLKAQE
jgi:two-component system response regulator YesN